MCKTIQNKNDWISLKKIKRRRQYILIVSIIINRNIIVFKCNATILFSMIENHRRMSTITQMYLYIYTVSHKGLLGIVKTHYISSIFDHITFTQLSILLEDVLLRKKELKCLFRTRGKWKYYWLGDMNDWQCNLGIEVIRECGDI